jgi:hypothetical protein
MKTLLVLSLVALAYGTPVSAQDRPDFSGTWVRDASADGFTLLSATIGRVTTGAMTWVQFAAAVRDARYYVVVIKQAPENVSIVFPGGADVMTQIPYRLDGVEHATVPTSTRTPIPLL